MIILIITLLKKVLYILTYRRTKPSTIISSNYIYLYIVGSIIRGRVINEVVSRNYIILS